MLNFYINSDKDKSSIIEFLNLDKIFLYSDFEKIKNIDKNRLIIFNQKTEKEDYLKMIESINKHSHNNVFLLIPKILSGIKIPEHFIKILYPIRYQDFKNKINKIDEEKKILFKNIFINKENILINTNNNSSAYLTETESKILTMLINKSKVKKDEIKTKILNLQTTIETKSLDSHLSRIRKKFNEIDSLVEIVSEETGYIAIKSNIILE